MAKVLVTGAAGFIGSHTVDHLLAAGHRVWGIDNFRTGRRENLAGALMAGLKFERLDVLDERRFDRFVRKVRPDAIIHLAALVSVTESVAAPDLNFRLNLEATYRLAEAARRYGVRRLVFASSAAVYGDSPKLPLDEGASLRPISPYGAAKLASEQLLLAYAAAYGITVRIQRYFNVFGPRQDPSSPYSGVVSIFVRQLARGLPITIYGDGRQTRDFLPVGEVARANVIAATKPRVASGVANICTGRPISLLDLVRLLTPRANAVKPHFKPARPGDIRHSAGTTRAARRALGFASRQSVAAALRQLAAAEPAAIPSRAEKRSGR
jgi:UDP-glucose 4-epimerase